MTTTFNSLRIRAYRIWFIGMTTSNLGMWIQRIAQDWLVLTVLTDNDATAVAITMSLHFLPPVVLLPLTAIVADRFDRKKTLVVTQGVQALLAVALSVLTLTGTIELWMVFVLSGALGVAAAFDQPVRQTFVSELIPVLYIGNAVALNQTSFNAGRLIGPGIGGLLVAAVGPGWAFVVNAFAFAGTLIALTMIMPSARDIPLRSASAASIREAFRYINGTATLLLIFVMMFFVSLFGLNSAIFIVTMTRIEFELDASYLGYFTSGMAVGALIGALFAARRGQPRLRHVVIAAGCLGVTFLAAAIAPGIWTFGMSLALLGTAIMTTTASANGFIQIHTPPELRGRVMASYLAVLSVAAAIGALIAGPLIDAFGPRWATAIGGTGGLIAATSALVWLVSVRSYRLSWNRNRRWRIRFAPEPEAGF